MRGQRYNLFLKQLAVVVALSVVLQVRSVVWCAGSRSEIHAELVLLRRSLLKVYFPKHRHLQVIAQLEKRHRHSETVGSYSHALIASVAGPHLKWVRGTLGRA